MLRAPEQTSSGLQCQCPEPGPIHSPLTFILGCSWELGVAAALEQMPGWGTEDDKHREEVWKHGKPHPCRKTAPHHSFPLETHPEGSEQPGSHLSTVQLGVPRLWAPACGASVGTTPCPRVSLQSWG